MNKRWGKAGTDETNKDDTRANNTAVPELEPASTDVKVGTCYTSLDPHQPLIPVQSRIYATYRLS